MCSRGYAVLVDRNPDWIIGRLKKLSRLVVGRKVEQVPVAFQDDYPVYRHECGCQSLPNLVIT